MAYSIINMAEDPRQAHYRYFTTLQQPQVGVTVMVDVTELAALCRARGCSFYTVMIHVAARAANGVKELRRRIVNGEVRQYDCCPTSHVEMRDNGTYGYCTLQHDLPFDAYLVQAEAARAACRESASLEEDEDAAQMYFISCLPWLHYTTLIQPTEGGEASNPRITWGRYEADFRGRLMLPLTLLAHHALVDGVHIAAFYDGVRQEISRLCKAEG